MQIALAQITVDPRCQPRAALDTTMTSEYAEAMRTGAIFPAVTVFSDGKSHWLSDGFHRVAAARSIDARNITANVRPGKLRDAILFACSANAQHGLRRTDEDKRRAVNVLLSDPEWAAWSDREIGRRANVSHEFVRKLRSVTVNVDSENPAAEATERTVRTKHGTVTTMNVDRIGQSRQHTATDSGLTERVSGQSVRKPSSDEDDFKPTPPHIAIAILARGIADHGASAEEIVATCPDDEARTDLCEACDRAATVLSDLKNFLFRARAA